MKIKPHKIAIVVNKDFGEKLIELSKRLHVWICDSENNLPFVKQVWSQDKKYSIESGVTKFDVSDNDSAEDIFVNILDDVDLHHGEFSHEPPWSIIEVYGVSVTQRIKSELSRYEEGRFEILEDGFIFHRSEH